MIKMEWMRGEEGANKEKNRPLVVKDQEGHTVRIKEKKKKTRLGRGKLKSRVRGVRF